ncbi:hypothetical protein FRC00_007536 [Tulasnella sp. 408]|nr:hypothetical protein FRC00_007536 [Tulasnella sp. 408]
MAFLRRLNMLSASVDSQLGMTADNSAFQTKIRPETPKATHPQLLSNQTHMSDPTQLSMQDSRGTGSRLTLPPPTRRATSLSATLFQADPMDMPQDEKERRIEKHLSTYRTVPYKMLVDALMLPSTIGTAIAAGGAFTILTTDSIFGDDSPQSLAHRKEMFQSLLWATELFGVATAITVCLQALYSDSSFCKILLKKLTYRPELKTKFEPWPSPDFLRYVIAYTAVGAAFLSLILHSAGTILMVIAFQPYGPTWIAKIFMVLIPTLGIIGWIMSTALEQRGAREFWTRLLRLRPAGVSAPVPEQRAVESPQAETKDIHELFSSRRRDTST